MKLYATISSERGKEIGKGGNDYIEIELLNEKKIPQYLIRYTNDLFEVRGAFDNDYLLRLMNDIEEIKGKSEPFLYNFKTHDKKPIGWNEDKCEDCKLNPKYPNWKICKNG